VARLYHAVGEAFGFDRVRQAAGAYAVGDNFERMALRRLIEDLLTQQADLTRAVMAFTGGPQAGEDAQAARDAASAWTALRRDKADVARRTVDDIEASGGPWTFAKLTIANAALRELAAEGAKRKGR
jgi:glutamate dehydrogenase